MTHRDLMWRGAGLALVAVAGIARLADGTGAHSALTLLAFILMLLGVVLLVQGKRVPAALRVERSRHRMLAQAIRQRRRTPPGARDG